MRKRNRKSAFTLVELLVVISIILLASSIIFIGGSGGEGAKLSSAQRIVSGIAQGARGQAILKNATTRLIIYSDNNPAGDPEKFLRYFGIAQLTSTADGASTGWVAATQGTYLPEGIYFNPDASQSSGSTSSGSVSWNKAANTMNLAYPRLTVESSNDGAGQEEYYYYEFDSNGTVSSSFMNNWLVLQAGTLKPGTGGSLSVDFTEAENVNLKTALIFRRAGTTTRVNDPGDID